MITIDLKNMAASLSAAEAVLRDLEDLDEEKRYKAAFICEEILTNLARHADFEGREPEVTLAFSFEYPDRLTLTFRDNAKSFDLLDFPDPDFSDDLDDVEAGGLGIFLTKQYARSLRYDHKDGCNMLEIVL